MIKKFKKIIKSNKQFYNAKPFPKNESDDDAHDRCDNDEGTLSFCHQDLGRKFLRSKSHLVGKFKSSLLIRALRIKHFGSKKFRQLNFRRRNFGLIFRISSYKFSADFFCRTLNIFDLPLH